MDASERLVFIDRSHGNKEGQARRWQPIPEAVWPLFEDRRQESGAIFETEAGRPWTPDARKHARKTTPGLSWKRLRTTYATLLAQAGCDVAVISRLLRHSAGGRVSVAERHYIGQSERWLRSVVDAALGGALTALTSAGWQP